MTLNTRWIKIIQDLSQNKARTLLAVLSIAVGVFAVGLIANAYILLDTGATDNYLPSKPASGFLITDPLQGFDEEMVTAVARMPEVQEAEGRRQVRARINLGDRWYELELYALDFDQHNINLLELTAGVFPPDKRQLLIDQTVFALQPVEVGQTAVVEMPDGSRYEMPVVGLARDVNVNPSLNTNRVNAYTDMESLLWLGESTQYNRLLFTTAEGQTDKGHVQTVSGLVRDRLEKNGHTVRASVIFNEPGANPINFLLDAIRVVLGSLAFVSLLLSGFLVYNTISALLLGQVQIIGIMKSVGASQRDLVGMYLVLVFAFGVLAFVLAVPLAAWGSYAFASFIASPANLDIKLPAFTLPPRVLLLELGVSVVVPLVAAFPAILRGAGITIREAISSHGLGDTNFGFGIIDRLIERLQFLSGPWLLSFGSMLLHKKRMFLTLGTLIVGGAVFIGVLSTRASSNRTVDEMGQEYRYDVEVSFDRAYRHDKIAQEALLVPGVTAVEGWGDVSAAILRSDGSEGESLQIMAPPAGSELTRPKILEGRWLLPEDEAALVVGNDIMEENEDLKLGEPFLIKIKGQQVECTIVGVYQVLGGYGIYYAYANNEYLADLTNSYNQVMRVQLTTTQHDPAFQEEVANRVENQLLQSGLRVSRVETGSALRGIRRQQFGIIVSVLIVMATLITLVGGLGMAGTMSMNVNDRSREIGVMRSIGATDRMVLRIVMTEGLMIALLSWLFAIGLAGPVGRLLSFAVGMSMFKVPLSYTYSVPGAFIWLTLVLVVSTTASYLPARRASKLTIRTVLAYE